MAYEKKFVGFKCENVEKESLKALYCLIQGNMHWVPKSQIGDESEVKTEGDSGIIMLSEWIAGEKGLSAVDGEAVKAPSPAKPSGPKIDSDDIPF
tara:strand:+ start:328 stop:612 length:285 start_codon:yes stop_codon:yes gene_type:complete